METHHLLSLGKLAVNFVALLTILLIPSVSHASGIKFELQRSQLEVSIWDAQQQLATEKADQIRELFVQRHASQAEYITAVAETDSAAAQLKASQDYLVAVKALNDQLLQTSQASQLAIMIPGFDHHPHLRKMANHIVAVNHRWDTIYRSQKYTRLPNLYLSSTAWRHQCQQLKTLSPSSQRGSEIAMLHHQAIIADGSERLRELEFQPLQIVSPHSQNQLLLLQELRQIQIAEANTNRSQRVTRILQGLPNSSLATQVSFSIQATNKADLKRFSKHSSPTITEWDHAISTARERIHAAVKTLSLRKHAAKTIKQSATSPQSNSLSHEVQLVKHTVVVAQHELEIRRTEHLYLIGRRAELFSKDPHAYRNWQEPLKQIFELRSGTPLVKLADIKVAINEQHHKSIQSLFDQGYASTKENMDAQVKLSRSLWQRDMLQHQCQVYGQIANLL